MIAATDRATIVGFKRMRITNDFERSLVVTDSPRLFKGERIRYYVGRLEQAQFYTKKLPGILAEVVHELRQLGARLIQVFIKLLVAKKLAR